MLSARLQRIPRFFVLPLLALGLVYGAEAVFVNTFGKPLVRSGVIQRKAKMLPNYTFFGWDSELYFNKIVRYEDPAFPPGYPLTLRGLEALHVERHAGAQLVNFLAHILIVFGLLAYLKQSTLGADFFFLAFALFFFPAHNVLQAAYPESAFLALTIWGLVLYRRERLLLSGIALSLAVLFRTQGVFLALAILLTEVGIQVKSKRHSPLRLLLASTGFLTAVLWNAIAYEYIFHSEYSRLFAGWIEDWTKWKVFLYLAFQGRWTEVLFFWSSLGGMAFLYYRRMIPEFLYLLLFHLSFLIHTYRPFAYSRYISVLFPLVLVGTHLMERKPRWKPAVWALFYLVACYYQFGLFSMIEGEP